MPRFAITQISNDAAHKRKCDAAIRAPLTCSLSLNQRPPYSRTRNILAIALPSLEAYGSNITIFFAQSSQGQTSE